MGILKSIIRQYNTGIGIGLLLSVYGTSCVFIGIAGQLMSASVFYNITAKPIAPAWFTIWVFYGICLGYVLLVMLISWKIIIPSNIRFNNAQGWEHGNPGRKLVEEGFAELNKRLEYIDAELKALKQHE